MFNNRRLFQLFCGTAHDLETVFTVYRTKTFENLAEKSVIMDKLKISHNLPKNKLAPVVREMTGGACNFIKKDTLTQVLSCELCEISKKTFSTEHVRTAASVQFSIRSKVFS